MFVDPLALSFTKRGELASLKQLLFLAFIESDGAPPNFSNVVEAVHPNGQPLSQCNASPLTSDRFFARSAALEARSRFEAPEHPREAHSPLTIHH